MDYYNRLEDPTDEENDMLDLAFGLTETSATLSTFHHSVTLQMVYFFHLFFMDNLAGLASAVK